MPVEADLVVRNAAELCTLTGDRTRGDEVLGAIALGAVASLKGRIVWTGLDSAVSSALTLAPGARTIDASGCTVTPGFVDCHTHVVFAGERADEFALRCGGASYLEIGERGGGIMSTVRATRAASEEELVALALPRLARLLANGVTSAEAKSGYGLTLADELKMLRAIRTLGKTQPIELAATLLCAHAVPAEHRAARERYLALCLDEILPAVAEAGLATFCDAFVEGGAFTLEEGRRILSKGRALGMTPRLHADQLSSMGASALAAELKAATADHLEAITPEGIAQLAAAGVTAVLAPTSTLFLRQPGFAPGKALWDAGVNVALATNLNPGSAMSESTSLAMSLACLSNGLTPAQALHGFTKGGAIALGISDRVGELSVGRQMDAVIHSCSSHRHLPYHLAISHVRTVLKRGEIVHQASLQPCG